MPAGLPYFAWIDATETTFGSEHLRWDEAVFSFKLSQDEGNPASLTLVVRRPVNDAGSAIGLLGPGRKIWAWFALDCGADLIRFRGRLVGIPTSIFEELVTLEFVAKPIDMVAQKATLADTLRVLPFYDEVVIDPSRRTDPDVVLEGYTAIWHFDRETHVITISDEITGEDGLVEFDGASEDGKVLYDGLGLTLTGGPLTRVDVSAEYAWTQQASGTVDLTGYMSANWPVNFNGALGSIDASAWPTNGSGIGDGWQVAQASAVNLINMTVQTKTEGMTWIIKNPDGSGIRTTVSNSISYIGSPPPPGYQVPVILPPVVITDAEAAERLYNANETISVSYAKDADGQQYVASMSRNVTSSRKQYFLQQIRQTLVAGYTAARPCTEVVSFSLFADVQPILTDPDDGEALLINDVKSVNLSESIGEGTSAYIPIGDPRRRSYITTARGNQSLEHLIALARANLMKRSRVVEIAFVPKLSRMPEITLRKNGFLTEPRVGEAEGKIIAYSVALDGSDGRINCEVRIGCAIGRGGTAVAAGGTPTYCSTAYAGFDYQQFVGRTILFDSSVGYEPPAAAPADDGIDFLAGLSADDAIDIPLSVAIGERETRATFKLKSMSAAFSTPYPVQVTDLKIPTGYDLETV